MAESIEQKVEALGEVHANDQSGLIEGLRAIITEQEREIDLISTEDVDLRLKVADLQSRLQIVQALLSHELGNLQVGEETGFSAETAYLAQEDLSLSIHFHHQMDVTRVTIRRTS